MRHVVRVFLPVCALVFSLTGCGQKEQTSQLTIAVPSEFPSEVGARSYAGKGNSALLSSDDLGAVRSASTSTAVVKLISVNITSAGAPVAKPVTWMAQSDSDVAPSTLTVGEVTRGTQRLIQVLVAAESTSDGGITF